MDERVRELRTEPLIDAARMLDVVGGAAVTVPLRIAVLLLLALLRRFSAFFAFAATWAVTAPATEA